jgi:hypothetical protein
MHEAEGEGRKLQGIVCLTDLITAWSLKLNYNSIKIFKLALRFTP